MSWSVELTFGSILELTQPTISPSNRSREILKLNCDHCTKKDCFKHQLQLSFFFTRLVDFFVIKHGFPRTLKFSVAWNLPHKSFLQRLPERWGGRVGGRVTHESNLIVRTYRVNIYWLTSGHYWHIGCPDGFEMGQVGQYWTSASMHQPRDFPSWFAAKWSFGLQWNTIGCRVYCNAIPNIEIENRKTRTGDVKGLRVSFS